MLCREGLDLNHLLRHGIRYLSKDEEILIRERENELINGIREQILIDEGGQAFLEQCRFFPLSPLTPPSRRALRQHTPALRFG
jgi:hypothetical protein